MAVAKAKTWLWEKFGEAILRKESRSLLRLSSAGKETCRNELEILLSGGKSTFEELQNLTNTITMEETKLEDSEEDPPISLALR